MITIIADEGKNKIGLELRQAFLAKGAEAEYISLENVRVEACLNCGGCNLKSYGKCVIRDDGDWIYAKVIRSDTIILVTPLRFGCYSFNTKRVLDKFGLIMDRHYYVENKELVKGGRLGKRFEYFAVGVKADCSDEEAETFKKLVQETLVISRGLGKAYVVGPMLSSEAERLIVGEVLRT